MDINKTYKNPSLENRRQELVRRNRAIAVLQKARAKAVNPRAEIEAAAADCERGPLSAAILQRLRTRKTKYQLHKESTLRLLQVAAARTVLLEPENYLTYLPILFSMAHRREWWLRKPETWRPHTHNLFRQFGSLLRHLFAAYHVPAFFDQAWSADDADHQAWFLHIGRGANLRTATNLPMELTKLMAHHVLLAPDGLNMRQAIRYGQAMGIGVSARIAAEIAASQIGAVFNTVENPFWTSVLRFFARHPMIDPHQIGPMIDYLHNQKFARGLPRWANGVLVEEGPPQPGLTMQHRDPLTLINQMEAWHRRLARVSGNQAGPVWNACGIPGYSRIEGTDGNKRLFWIRELLSSGELRADGAAMRHCVASYAQSCRTGYTAIYSMGVSSHESDQRLLTIELTVRDRRIVQARGRFNASPSAVNQRILRAWASVSGLTFGHGVLRE